MSHQVTRVGRQLLGVASRERWPGVIEVRTGLHPFCKARRVTARTGPAGDFDYEVGGGDYAARRRADPRIAELVHGALGAARTVLNVGAGAGSYEPADRMVLAVEPAARMRAQRRPGRLPAVNAVAESLPFDDGAFDAAMAMVTLHQWSDPVAGLVELRRVARGPVVILTFDGAELDRLWLGEYVPELFTAERRRYPPLDQIGRTLGGAVDIREVPVAIDCTDGFTEAFYARPEAFLDPDVRAAQSAWGFVAPDAVQRGMARLAEDLADGRWDAEHGHLRTSPTFTGSLRLVVSTPASGCSYSSSG
jgi:SAM-dependent methyltransferase